jgi:hypothetical protein
MFFKIFFFALALFVVSVGRGLAQEPAPAAQSVPPQTAAGQQSQTDDLAQMQADLNQLESLHNLMSSEIEFLHDQNLQILLRTNAQMWTVLTRDLRRLIDREEQRRRADQPASGSTHPKSTDKPAR